ncbi:hypothetical protein AB7M26_004730 [Pseudomonas sp. F-14 TE3482]|uniref:hypothetical protein n=1 Tax=Pseudomonas frederiksbergensis TaxID=104087 RepID=UPI001C8324CC|nr:hypothetical protein [Pseudomonas frederiksbergensis]
MNAAIGDPQRIGRHTLAVLHGERPGMTFSLAGVNTDSVASSVQASRAPPTEIIKPILINTDDALRTCRAFES